MNPSELARIKRKITIEGECWVWTGPKTPNGYGKHRKGPGQPDRVVHRILWEHENDQEIPEGMQLDHLCRNRACCNPAHFEVVTPSENTMRQDHFYRNKEACPKGHAYDEANTRVSAQGKRVCRECDRLRKRVVTGFAGTEKQKAPAADAAGALAP